MCNMKSFLFIFLFLTCKLATCKQCIQHWHCQCTFDDGSGIFDLSTLGKTDGTPLMKDQYGSDNYAYSFNPCFPFTEGTCTNAAACQFDSNNYIYYNIGDASRVTLTFNGVNVIGVYVSDDGVRSSNVTFQCDPSVDRPIMTAHGEVATTVYAFTITSKEVCLSSPPTPTPTPTPGERCFTNFGDFTKRCSRHYDGKDRSIKVLIIDDWDGSCALPTNQNVAISLRTPDNPTCDDVIKRCNPVQAFSVNGYVCKEVTGAKCNKTDPELIG